MIANLFRYFAVTTVIFLSACEGYQSAPSFVAVEQDRTSLVGELKSYQTISEARSSLGPLAEKWEVLEDSGKGARSSRPPFEIFTTVVHGYEHNGFKGDLRLMFFNNRLTSTWFYPDDPVSYRKALSVTTPALKEHDSTSVAPYTVISIAMDHRGKQYFAWADSRLQKEMSIWIKRYS